MILALIVIVGSLALFQFSQIKTTVTNLADNLAQDQYLAEQMVTQILLVRFYANKYIRNHKTRDLTRFKEELSRFEKFLMEASIKITKNERVKMLNEIKTGVKHYSENVTKIIQLLNKRREIITKTVNVQGPLADQKLEKLRDSAFKAGDGIAAFYAANIQRDFLLIRLDAFKYLEEGKLEWVKKLDQRYQEVQSAFKYLKQEMQDPTRQELALAAQTSIEQYYQAFISLQADYKAQNQIIETQLNIIGPKIRETASKMSKSVSVDFNATKQKNDILINQIRWQLNFMMLVALFIGISLGLFISRNITLPLVKVIEMSNQMAIGMIKQNVNNDAKMNKLLNRVDEIGNLGRAYNNLANYFNAIITDIVHVSQGLAKGESVVTQAKYQGDFIQIKDALETASSKLTTTMKKNTVQDWIKSGQANLDELIRGEQDITTLAKNIIAFLCKYMNAQVGLFYLVKKDEEIPYLQIIAGYAYVDDNQRPSKYLLGEGLVGEVALEKKPLIFAQTIEECPNIIRSGLANAMPRNLILLPCLYENEVKAVIEIGSQAKVSDTQYKFLEQVMSGIGIAINTADSRAKMQVLLEQSQQQSEELQQKQQEMQDTNHKLRSQSEELQSQQEELQTQQEELRQTNEVLEERTSSLEKQKGQIQNKNKALEQTKSEMQKAQEAILIKAKELELASKYKSEFLANMSHELRTPLNSLLILAQLLSENKKGNLDDKQVEYAKTMYSAGNDLLTLINDILDLSKVEAGKVEINWEDIDLSDLFNTIKQKFQPIAENKNLGFDITIATNIPTIIIADGQRIKQIVNNLLSNAFKFTSKGNIQLIVKRPLEVPINLGGHNLEVNKTLSIDVIDSGIGIPKDKQQVVFEAFQQADGSTSRKFGGTGLGLSISRQLARLMGGEL
ncbi:MAG: GAF domain-containing protein, partial [Thiomargarita sp.]|nr:GAF domain-containing protein [Thiomargarita sp.]